MTRFHVHIYREMRLTYEDIEAATPDEAAEIARSLDSSQARVFDDCDGQTFAALVDVAGDEQFEQSRTIDFEAGRMLDAALTILEALEEVIQEIEYHHSEMLTEYERGHPRGSGWARVYDKARAATAKARSA